jgi:hypothetical protein
VARKIDEDELIERWTLVGDELTQVVGKRGATTAGSRAVGLSCPTRRLPTSRVRSVSPRD